MRPYKVVVDKEGCSQCGHETLWTIEGPDETCIGQSFGDEEFVNDLADHMNDAYEAGAASGEGEHAKRSS